MLLPKMTPDKYGFARIHLFVNEWPNVSEMHQSLNVLWVNPIILLGKTTGQILMGVSEGVKVRKSLLAGSKDLLHRPQCGPEWCIQRIQRLH